jgi:hypothetical protein
VIDDAIAAAGRNRAMVRDSAFGFTMTREFGYLATERRDSSFSLIRRDTVRRMGPRAWRYVAPKMIDPPLAGSGMGDVVNLIELADVADSAFLDSHCWQVRGMELVHGQRLRRVDVHPLSTMRAPDLSGSVYLDSATNRVVRSAFDLVRSYTTTGQTVTQRILIETLYREEEPGVPMASEVVTIVERNVAPECVPAGFTVACPPETRITTRETQRLIRTTRRPPGRPDRR